MEKNIQESNILGIPGLREAIRKVVSERVYRMLNESMFEADDKKDDSSYDWDNPDKEKSKSTKTGSNRVKEWRPQVVAALKDPKINNAPIARALHPDVSDDAARSWFSKQVNGKRPFEDDEIITAHQLLANTTNKLDEESRPLTNEEVKSLHDKLCSRKND